MSCTQALQLSLLTRAAATQEHREEMDKLRAQLNETGHRAEQATLRAAEAERLARVASIERHQAADGHAELGSVFPLVRVHGSGS
jgi:hypothetical protein